MDQRPTYRELIDRLRARDEGAAVEIVRRYEPILCRSIQARLKRLRLRRLLDAADVCQTVLARFFLRASWGRFELDTPEQLNQLLFVMARHELANVARQHRAARRDHRRIERRSTGADEPVEAVCPSQLAAQRELLHEVRRRLSPDERELLSLREQGLEWTAIAARRGGSPEALRKQLRRAIERAASALDADEPTDNEPNGRERTRPA
jgi:RNA polymerase sigma factor (sigma-70 family)